MTELTGVVVHWHDEDALRELVAAWPEDPRCDLVVVDNSRSLDPSALDGTPARLVDPGRNLGFGGGVNCGAAISSAPWILVLNPDAAPEPGAVVELLTVCRRFARRWPDTVGVAPALTHPDGSSQHRWQLQPLPTPWTLLAQCCVVGGELGPDSPPAAGAVVEQPAAAVLALRREVFETYGGFDEDFYPAWFEDVDLARRLADAGRTLRYAPSVRFRHGRGGSVSALGYGRFLWLYDRHLVRYLRRHHGAGWARLATLVLVLALGARLLLLPLRRPRRATSRRDAARGLLAVAAGALSAWTRPRSWADRFRARRSTDGDAT